MSATGSPRDDRFAFGRNWRKFSRVIDDDRVEAAVANLRRLIDEEQLDGKRFLDIGCGSGLSSLAAIRLGADVQAFDYDPDSVTTSIALRDRNAIQDSRWSIEQGSILDADYVAGLGKFDIVYSWGVLHHTGAMWQAIDYAAAAVKSGGKFALALYNDQGGASRRWLAIKKRYVGGSRFTRLFIAFTIGVFFECRAALIRLFRLHNPLPFQDWKLRREDRGMSVYYDLIDWVGGYPFEVAKPEKVLLFLKQRGFVLDGIKTCAGGHGCNEFLFVRT